MSSTKHREVQRSSITDKHPLQVKVRAHLHIVVRVSRVRVSRVFDSELRYLNILRIEKKKNVERILGTPYYSNLLWAFFFVNVFV